MSKQSRNTPQSHEPVYYVDANTGNDANAGARNSPWKTLQRACEIADAGDTVYVMEGVYTGDVFPKNVGTEAKTAQGHSPPPPAPFDSQS